MLRRLFSGNWKAAAHKARALAHRDGEVTPVSLSAAASDA